ncbi:uroporphyrinogen-III C-methyltransferase [Azovibrio restrictus]|uniref:uroporphyrinogen-III C-methyltransferase n=1 Tax=Azovibrio restrictus TaxID=146938 RepID=UPI0026EB5BEA|nr:uroporphyrinogen-III C-methyltransferase [Azovibrio restrictus]MDD3481454.1 uroporphyrinogen-III C-methyltransferase [Azovibrio restrictus]
MKSTYETGSVALVGAGPGDPELLTLKALRLIQAADVVVHDNLVGQDIMAMIPQAVARIYVGKKASNHTLPQEEISALLLRLAREGKRVVRLKGGDPFVFGRGGEEMEVLLAAGIPVQIVPGITAALGAGAAFGFPLTHRDHAQSCVFVTGHLKDHSVNLDWPALARPGQTLVFYMGIAGLETIAAELQAHGLAGSTPAALVYKATLPEQQRWSCTLATLVDTARQHQVKPPALVIIGSVLELASG